MPEKTQKIYELMINTSKALSQDYKVWQMFLKTAAWQYKYPFNDRLLIFAQRPDAKACARIDVWNNSMHRWVNRGSKGIALLRENGNRMGLEYVFDVSDTHSRSGNDVWLPNNTFKANVGTEVTSDILFLQKRDKMMGYPQKVK